MKTTVKSTLFVSVILFFASCATPEQPVQPVEPQGEATPISLYSEGIDTKAATDLQAIQVLEGTQVGVYVYSGNTAITNGTNNKHTVGAKGAMTTENTMVYPANAVNIYAYAPYSSSTTFSVATDQSTDANYLASDLIYAAKTDVTESSEAVGLQFSHKMAKIILNVTANDAINLSSSAVTLKNVATTVTLDVLTGAVTTGNAKADVKVATGKGTYAALIAPQTFAAGNFVTIGSYTAAFSTAKTFEAGKVYTYNIKINTKAEIVAENITDWVGAGTTDIDIL